MKIVCLVFTLGLLCLSFSNPAAFHAEKEDASQLLESHRSLISSLAATYDADANAVLSIVFPELIRHNLFRDFLETSLLEQFYVQHGTESADFSIGPFQMKPSFIEKLERQLYALPALIHQFYFIHCYDETTASAIRYQRLQRLQSFEWQLSYAFAFYALMNDCYAHLSFSDETAKIRFFATAYNFGFDENPAAINKWAKVKAFPYGRKIPLAQEAYADISLQYFNTYRLAK